MTAWLSLSGHPLEGEKIVRLVYMDEAGISNPQHEPFVVVSGVMVDADKKLVAVERHLDSLVTRFIPEEHRDGFVFHANQLFNGGGPVFKRNTDNWSLTERLKIADCLAAVPKKFKLPLCFGFVERAKFPSTIDVDVFARGDKTVAAHVIAFVTCAMQVEMWMRDHVPGEVCMLVVENNEQARQLISDTQATYQSASALRKMYDGIIAEREAQYFPYRRIKQRPLFEPKAPSSVLQLADFCAYVIKKRLMGDARYDRFFGPVYEMATEPDLVVSEKRRR